jgi:conjugal transfer pilus assembly protein TraV
MRRLLLLVTLLSLGACSTTPRYACPIPDGVGGCRSLAQVYHDTQALDGSDTPGAAGAKPDTPHPDTSLDDAVLTHLLVAAGTSAMPLAAPGPEHAVLSLPRVLRVLITPWADADGDLQAGGHLYLRLDDGQWTIPH